MTTDNSSDTNPLPRGLELRSLLTWYLHRGGPLTVSELERMLERDAVPLRGRASKTISDALRWEVARGRVVRVHRGAYAPGSIPRSTEHRIRQRVRGIMASRSAAA